MKEKKRGLEEFSQPESQLIKQLRLRPQMMERIQKILEIADNGEGPLKNGRSDRRTID